MSGDQLRVDVTGTVHPLGKEASQSLRARAGEWRLLPSTKDTLLLRHGETADGLAILKLAGELRTPGALCDIVALIAQSQWRGELAVMGEDSARSLYFDHGHVLGASTNVKEERLGETLYRFGVVSREQLEEILKVTEGGSRRLGEVAIELGYVSAEALYPMMARQVEEVFYGAIGVEEGGTFFFYDRFDEKILARHQNLNAGGLLMEAARRMDEMRFFQEKVPNEHFIPVKLTSAKKPPDEIARVWNECDGARSVEEIGRHLGLLEFEVTKAVFQLVNGGLVAVVAPRPRGAEAIVEAFNPALAALHHECDRVSKGAELRDGLGRFATGGGVYDALFMGAGPQPDGTLRPARVAKNLGALAGDDPDAWLMQLLQDYVGFGLFQAESLLPRGVLDTLSVQLAEMLKPLRQAEPPVPSITPSFFQL